MGIISDYHAPETRRRVLELLKLHGPMTAQRLAEELGITVMGVRGQLAALERDGIIRHEIVPQKLG
ncbi:MAG: winged helix-turn-helix transcriptional regulator, partial [Candidatus Bipolaricaulota bacterium]|nr:winged helix-turn-helix transcriptional regulator [Candidatus Bipolaricaulota bacterium]MDW8141538.1 winged helix-turn-helix transcriptional regulator [Candidatus Bipolaricaulota bacterium]